PHLGPRARLAAAALIALVGACSGPNVSPRTSESEPGSSSDPATSETLASACPPPPPSAAPAAAPLGQPGWWNGRVFYEVFVRSFADSDGDGIGDLRGLTAHLDALNDGDPTTTTDLGITGIWLMPIASSPSYHGYDVSDERAVEVDYGTLDDLKAFVAEAHKRGIAVITDLVLNHTSSANPWFRESRAGTGHDDWYIWSPTNPGYGGPDGQQVWHAAGNRFYYGLFGADLPDLNLKSPAVTAEMTDVARYWLTEVGLDGFRLDAIKHLVEDGAAQVHTPETHAWLQAFRSAIHETAPNALLVGEVYDVSVAVARYVPEDVDLAFDFDRAQGTVDSLVRGDGSALVGALTDDQQQFGPDETAGFLTNHDQTRIASRLDDPAALQVAAGLLLTGGGTPFVYYGEEIGLTGEKPDENIRTPMAWTGEGPAAGFTTGTPWEPPEPGWETRNVAAESADPASLLSTYRDLIRLRAAHASLSGGPTAPLMSSDPKIVAYLRLASQDRTAIIANVSNAAVEAPAFALDGGPLCSGKASVLYRTGLADAASLPVKAPIVGVTGGFHDWTPFDTV
ncbi:MAG TPA: alpha-amylase family glycosyl hydrolase, partial [Candidatus Limnocylindrales bacterium]